MTPEQLQHIRWFKSQPLPLEFAADRIDREAGVLYDVVMVEEGEAKGHELHLEEEFINDLVAYDVKHYARRGLKNRFGHPRASESTMGSQMGYFTNFRTRKKGGKMQAIADLHLLDAADISPTKPNMREWMLRMATEAPDFVMMSIVFKESGYYQRNDKEEKVPMKVARDDDGFLYWENYDPKKKLFVEFGTKGVHYYTDTVEAGAAADNLFSTEANPRLFVSKALSWLDEHPELKDFARQHPDKVQQFLQSLGINTQQPKTFTMKSLKELLFGSEKTAEDVALTPDQVQELRDKLSQAETALADAAKKFQDTEASVKKLQAEVDDLKTKLQERDDKIMELQAQIPAAQPTRGPKAADNDDALERKSTWANDPINKQVREMYERKAAKKTAAA